MLLLDEPLGALDAKLRKALQLELKSLQETIGITFLHVTHDQEEALALSDRLAVMRGGRVEQVGSPAEVYQEPASTYVADFFGVANLMAAHADGPAGEGRCRVRLGEFGFDAGQGETGARGEVNVVVRPERVRLEPHGSGANRMPAMVERLVYLGPVTQLIVRLAMGEAVQAVVRNGGEPLPWQQGSAVAAYLLADALRVLRADGPEAGGPEPVDPEAAGAEG